MNNTASGTYSSIVGGQNNIASGSRSFIGGGNVNAASGVYSVIVGGLNNTASGNYSITAGGRYNVASGSRSSVGGGMNNTASGDRSFIGGGMNNTASGTYSSIVGGSGGIAARYGMSVISSGYFSSVGDAQAGSMILRNITTNATLTEMFSNGSSQVFFLIDNETIGFDAQVVGRRTDIKTENCYFTVSGMITRGIGNASVSVVGSPVITVITRPNTNWSVSVDANTSNGSLRFRVTGETGKTINWVSSIRFTEIVG